MSGNYGGSKKFEGGLTKYKLRRHLSHMHTTNYMSFIREGIGGFLNKKKFWANRGHRPSPPSLSPPLLDDYDEIVILASSTIIFSNCELLCNNKEVLIEKGVALPGLEVTCSLVQKAALIQLHNARFRKINWNITCGWICPLLRNCSDMSVVSVCWLDGI